ncbi:MAG: hypothetical protein IJ709_12555 [Selenomonas sp.]|nr:hypothetical protein [Selenomonas sp.]
MQEYNDYEQLVYKYLRNYNQFQAQIDSIDIEIRGIENQLKTLGGLKAVRYDTVAVSGGEKTSTVEQACERMEHLEQRLPILQANKERLLTLLAQIDNALKILDKDSRKIVQLKFITGYRWMQVALETKFSEHSCQIRAKKAVRQIAVVLFPERAVDNKSDFVFVCEA